MLRILTHNSPNSLQYYSSETTQVSAKKALIHTLVHIIFSYTPNILLIDIHTFHLKQVSFCSTTGRGWPFLGASCHCTIIFIVLLLYVVDSVCGVNHTDNIMYVVCRWSSTIRLYNMDTGRLLNVIDVDGMKDPCDIVVCRDDRQLYIAELDCIWRVSLDDQSYTKWLTTTDETDESFYCTSLSLTSRRLLLTLSEPHLRQYNMTDRQLLRVVSLTQYMTLLWHSVETTRGTFVVCHYGTAEDMQQCAVSELFSFVN